MARKLVSDVSETLQKVEKKMPGKKRGANKTPPLSLTEMQNVEQYARILSSLRKVVTEASTSKTPIDGAGMKEITNFVEGLCSNLSKRDLIRLSAQEVSFIF